MPFKSYKDASTGTDCPFFWISAGKLKVEITGGSEKTLWVVFKNPDHITMTYSFRIHPSLTFDENSIVMSFITSPDKDIRHDAVHQKYYRPRFLRIEIE